MAQGIVSLDFRLKKIDETRNFLLDEIKHGNLLSKKYKKVCRALNYFEHFCYFCFYCQWFYFNFCIRFIRLCSCRYRKFCSRNKDLRNNCWN